MTTLTLTIGGADFLPQYKTGSIKITEQIQNQGNTLNLQITKTTLQSAPVSGQEIMLMDGARTLFSGYITKTTPQEYGIGSFVLYKVEAMDQTYILANKEAQASYENMTLGDIVADLLLTIDAGYGITGTNVVTGPPITTINFNHISIRQCFENLGKVTGYIWWIDYDKDVHFINPAGGLNLAPESLTDAVKNHESIVLTTDITQIKNDIIVQGGTQESANYEQIIVGDGSAREWVLVYPVKTMVSVQMDTGGGYSAKTFGVDPRDDVASFDFMYSPERGSIRCGTGTITPAATTTKVKVTFTYPLPVLTEVQSAASIVAMKALEGGDGLHTFTINDATIVSQAQATQRALQELEEFADPVLSGNFKTRTGLLSAGSYFAPGQAITVNLPSWGISVDTVYVIQKVTITAEESGSAIEYHYDVTFGGRLLGVLDFLQALATPESPLDTSQEVQKIKAISEVVAIVEAITRNGNVRSVAESVTIVETTPAQVNTTPPFKWAPSGTKKMIWGKFEWG